MIERKRETVSQNDKGKLLSTIIMHPYARFHPTDIFPSILHLFGLHWEWSEWSQWGACNKCGGQRQGHWGVTLSKIAPQSGGHREQRTTTAKTTTTRTRGRERVCRQGRGRRLRGKRGNREIRWRKTRRNWTIPEICAIAGFVSGTWLANPTTVVFHASWVPSFGVAAWSSRIEFGQIPRDFRSKFLAPQNMFWWFSLIFSSPAVRHLDWKPPKRRANARGSVTSRSGTWTNPTLGHRCLIGF